LGHGNQFTVDISDTMDTKIESVRCYQTQFPPEKSHVVDRIRGVAMLAGAGAGVAYGEVFVNTRSIVTSDLVKLLRGGVEQLRAVPKPEL
jgi:LmbE family N-acetylglucosaminyl deacetylase